MNKNNDPSVVYLIRHGEKLGDASNDKDGGPDLSVRGSARAAALPSLFLPGPQIAADAPTAPSCALDANGGSFAGVYHEVPLHAVAPPRFRTPRVIYATNPGSGGEAASGGGTETSHRPLETIAPLAAALQLTPKTPYSDKHYAKVAHDVRHDYPGQVVLICWHHGTIQALAEKLGATGVKHWDGTVFDRVWEIDYAQNQPQFTDHPQSLLFCDAAT
jgi:hypothetical protein